MSAEYQPLDLIPKKEDRFAKTHFKDTWAAVLFGITTLAFGSVSYFGFQHFYVNVQTTSYLYSIAASFVIATFATFAYYLMMQAFPQALIVFTIVSSILINVFVGLSLLSQSTPIALFLLVIAGLNAFWFYTIRSRIPLSSLLIKTVVAVSRRFWGSLITGFLAMVASTCVSTLVFVTMLGVSSWLRENDNLWLIQLFCVFYLFWASQVVTNTAHLTICGLFATFYYMGVSNGQNIDVPVKNPSAKSAYRALTTSFGSNCFGSLVIAIVETLRFISQVAKHRAEEERSSVLFFIACCFQCIFSLIRDILEYMNKYAFAQVAIYGKDYCSAGRDTWALFKSKGIDAIINDILVGRVLGLGSLLVGIVSAVGTFIYASAQHIDPPVSIVLSVVGFFIGVAQFSIVASVVDSGIVATFVCLAEDPEALAHTKPELYQKFKEVYPEVSINF